MGQALVFDGADDYLQLPPDVASSTDFTFAAWVNWGGGDIWQRVFDFGNDANQFMFLTPSSYSNTLRFSIKNGGDEQQVEDTVALPINVWSHVAVSLSGNTARLYVNGNLVATNTAITINPSDFSARRNFIGKSQFAPDPLFAGMIDEIHIVDRALSDSEIMNLSMEQASSSSSSSSTSSSGGDGTVTQGGASSWWLVFMLVMGRICVNVGSLKRSFTGRFTA